MSRETLVLLLSGGNGGGGGGGSLLSESLYFRNLVAATNLNVTFGGHCFRNFTVCSIEFDCFSV